MTVTLRSTTRIIDANGIKFRVWEGKTENGIECMALIPRIAAHKDQDLSQFERELEEQAPPSAAAEMVFPLRMII